MERVGYDKRIVFVSNLCNFANLLTTAVGPGDIVNRDEGGLVVDSLLPLFQGYDSVRVRAQQTDLSRPAVLPLQMPHVDVGWKVEAADHDVAVGLVLDAAGKRCQPGGDARETRDLVEACADEFSEKATRVYDHRQPFFPALSLFAPFREELV